MKICVPPFTLLGIGDQGINSDHHSILDPRPLPSLMLCNSIVQLMSHKQATCLSISIEIRNKAQGHRDLELGMSLERLSSRPCSTDVEANAPELMWITQSHVPRCTKHSYCIPRAQTPTQHFVRNPKSISSTFKTAWQITPWNGLAIWLSYRKVGSKIWP